jgi:hypothetical protein
LNIIFYKHLRYNDENKSSESQLLLEYVKIINHIIETREENRKVNHDGIIKTGEDNKAFITQSMGTLGGFRTRKRRRNKKKKTQKHFKYIGFNGGF